MSAANFALPPELAAAHRVRATSMMVEVTSERLKIISEMIGLGELKIEAGELLPLPEARKAHEMLEGAAHNGARSCSR
jgi:hypothetical protein